MPETFLILLAGGIMLAGAISDPRQVTLNWLRLGGIIALVMAGLALYFYFTRQSYSVLGPTLVQIQAGLMIATAVAILAQLAFVQIAWRNTQRAFAFASFTFAVLAGVNVLHEMMIAQQMHARFPPKALSIAIQTLSTAGASAMCGLVLMDMLLGHAYLTASKMTIHPFRRLNFTLMIVLLIRVVSAVILVLALNAWRPLEMLWGVQGLLMLTRWLVGLVVPAIFLYMAHDCIRRRSTQSATGILYVAGLMIFLGEIVALHLVRATGLPF